MTGISVAEVARKSLPVAMVLLWLTPCLGQVEPDDSLELYRPFITQDRFLPSKKAVPTPTFPDRAPAGHRLVVTQPDLKNTYNNDILYVRPAEGAPRATIAKELPGLLLSASVSEAGRKGDGTLFKRKMDKVGDIKNQGAVAYLDKGVRVRVSEVIDNRAKLQAMRDEHPLLRDVVGRQIADLQRRGLEVTVKVTVLDGAYANQSGIVSIRDLAKVQFVKNEDKK